MVTTQQNRTVRDGTSATLLLLIVWQNGVSSLTIASLNGHVQVVAELLQHGARVDLQQKVWSLCFSCFVACVRCVQSFIHALRSMYTDCTLQVLFIITLLWSKGQQLSKIEQLALLVTYRWCRVVHHLYCGTLLLIFTIVWQGGLSPLMIASHSGRVQVVAELLQHGARVDMQDEVWSIALSVLLVWELTLMHALHTS